MDALKRADQVLARAQARHADIVTPDSATSPMDLADTVQIPRVTVTPDPQPPSPHTLTIPTPVFTRKPHHPSDFGPFQP